jgi:hypothetical protein
MKSAVGSWHGNQRHDAIEATSHPVNYMRKLGTEIGLLYPPTNFHTDKRFVLAEEYP